MAEFKIATEKFATLQGSVVVVTGASSGIGLATTTLLLDVGAFVVAGDMSPVPVEHENLSFQKTDIISWQDLQALFGLAQERHGKVDHVFANAGIPGRTIFIEDRVDENGLLLEPDLKVIDVNLKGTIFTATLGLHYIKKQGKGSIVITASASSFQRFGFTDYTVSKHGVLGYMRGLVPSLNILHPSIRINAISPNWTATGIVAKDIVEGIGAKVQGPEVPARSAVLLMADDTRQGQLIYSVHGRYVEIEEAVLLKSVRENIVLKYQPEEDTAFDKMAKLCFKDVQKPSD
ncbi:hypothetical protein BGZ61DRAFT_358792 [Ilyonectria robusta]|uniref:uncharacterized protein n=1 Tax=Ilyonectria robusta TaxID=1079257 RepID=UPI001E8D1BE5|nr:uncharacterized protein BGZ61DRAFT_358792 [Ilyonectria robusta]KAH8680254.1 hypothetical protein BGZ61DRAFT_358792 [Ilyonectria robusta]